MTTLEQLETKIRQSIPELKEEYEAFDEDSSVDRDITTPIMLNHVLEYLEKFELESVFAINSRGDLFDYDGRPVIDYLDITWNLKSAYLKDQSEELITFLNELK